eukprot:jgi/Mesvir1/29563/Mv21374-RA.1
MTVNGRPQTGEAVSVDDVPEDETYSAGFDVPENGSADGMTVDTFPPPSASALARVDQGGGGGDEPDDPQTGEWEEINRAIRQLSANGIFDSGASNIPDGRTSHATRCRGAVERGGVYKFRHY